MGYLVRQSLPHLIRTVFEGIQVEVGALMKPHSHQIVLLQCCLQPPDVAQHIFYAQFLLEPG